MKTKLVVLLLSATGLFAQQPEEKFPVQLSLTPDIALEPRTTVINGISIGIWNENPQHGAAFGIVNGATGSDSAGFSWGIVNYSDSFKGVNWGVVNINRQSYIGWQRGFVNVDNGAFVGYQEGFVNISQDVTGFQLALVNYAKEFKGVQIGIVNIVANNPWFEDFPKKLAPVFPIINWSF